MNRSPRPGVAKLLGRIPNRFALAGGWIDQPFISRRNPQPPGSMVVVSLEPNFRPMDRAGCATGTRAIAMKLWHGRLPKGNPGPLIRELYHAENKGKRHPSGSQDMIGLVYPGISRLDYDFAANGGVFPTHIESLTQPATARWLERIFHVIPIAPRPLGYSPLGVQRLEPKWIARLGQTGKECFTAIAGRELARLGEAMNECMTCWEKILPRVLRHRLIKLDLNVILKAYQHDYPGAMYSGCGGGYLFVVSESPVPGSFRVKVRL